ncbi:MAG TPA: ribonuclease E/G, partial [Terriglobales bacterium]|nr:ribonuclease E/G [Terriglobales bacterium]
MNKELFVSSTPHETKVGLVEDDLLAEVYLERENEYTLAGSIYKGRVTRVLPGMQSAFVDIGLERDAFLYVSDFMDLEEHDDDLTEVVPANRAVQDMRPQPERAEPGNAAEGTETAAPQNEQTQVTDEGTFEADALAEGQPGAAAGESAEPSNGGDSQRDRGSWRGRRRRRGGRRDGRDGRDRGSERGSDRGNDRDRGQESRYSRPAESSSRTPAGPPPGYQPILLPGESISKYQRYSQQAHPAEAQPASAAIQEVEASEADSAVASTFPEDEPIFAAGEAVAEPLHEEHEDTHSAVEEPLESASTTTSWGQEFVRSEEPSAPAAAWNEAPAVHDEEQHEAEAVESDSSSVEEHGEESRSWNRHEEDSPAFAAPGTMEEETIEEDEADTVHYQASSEESDDEFEEETQAAGSELNGTAREAVSEIHLASVVESGEVDASAASATEAEEDSEEAELEEAQAQAEAMLDAEARGNGTVDARAEVRAPANAGYTQRSQRRSGYERPGYDRRDRGRRGGGGGGRRFRRRESAPVPLISDLLKEGQEILVQIAKEPIGKKGARITSHIALPGRFLVYMPTVNHTGVSRKISSEEERQRLKRIILSERENGHGGFIVRTAAQSASEDELR